MDAVLIAREIRNDERFMEVIAEMLSASYHSWQGSDEEKSLRFADKVEAEVKARFLAKGATKDDAMLFLHGFFYGVMTMANVDVSQDGAHRAR